MFCILRKIMMFSILIRVIQSGNIRDTEEVARMGQTINP